MFDVFIRKIQFGIGDAVVDWHTRTGKQELRYHGVTTGLRSDPIGHFTAEWPRVDINISRQVLQPLLRNDLSASEIMGHRWYAASLMCHELMVCGSRQMSSSFSLTVQACDELCIDWNTPI